MKTRTIAFFAAFLVFSTSFIVTVPSLGAQVQTPDRLQWFREAKFGLFIHWGVYSMIGREEWARQLLQIPLKEYQYYADNFNPVDFDPDTWAALAKD
jgi:alpha-L-fucosidase